MPATVEWLARGAAFTPDEIQSLFESNSPLLRENPYALGVPANTLRALQSDWRVFVRFRGRNSYPAKEVSTRCALLAPFLFSQQSA